MSCIIQRKMPVNFAQLGIILASLMLASHIHHSQAQEDTLNERMEIMFLNFLNHYERKIERNERLSKSEEYILGIVMGLYLQGLNEKEEKQYQRTVYWHLRQG